MARETGKASQAGFSARPPPAPPVPKVSATSMAASAMTLSMERSIWPAIERQREADGDDADEGRLLEDVEQDADLEELRDEDREGGERDQEDDPDQVVEDEGEERLVALLPRLVGGVDHWTPVIARG